MTMDIIVTIVLNMITFNVSYKFKELALNCLDACEQLKRAEEEHKRSPQPYVMYEKAKKWLKCSDELQSSVKTEEEEKYLHMCWEEDDLPNWALEDSFEEAKDTMRVFNEDNPLAGTQWERRTTCTKNFLRLGWKQLVLCHSHATLATFTGRKNYQQLQPLKSHCIGSILNDLKAARK